MISSYFWLSNVFIIMNNFLSGKKNQVENLSPFQSIIFHFFPFIYSSAQDVYSSYWLFSLKTTLFLIKWITCKNELDCIICCAQMIDKVELTKTKFLIHQFISSRCVNIQRSIKQWVGWLLQPAFIYCFPICHI